MGIKTLRKSEKCQFLALKYYKLAKTAYLLNKFILPEYIVMMLIVLGIYNFGPGLRAPYCEYMCTDQLAQWTSTRTHA